MPEPEPEAKLEEVFGEENGYSDEESVSSEEVLPALGSMTLLPIPNQKALTPSLPHLPVRDRHRPCLNRAGSWSALSRLQFWRNLFVLGGLALLPL